MMHILFKDFLFTCSHLEPSICWKIEKGGSRTKLALLRKPYSDRRVPIWKYSQEISSLWAEVLSQVYFIYQ